MSMFWECSSLITLDLSSFNTQNVTDMENMFYKCSSMMSYSSSDKKIINEFNKNKKI